MTKKKKRILLLTSSFPRFAGDFFGPWIYEYAKELVRQDCEVIVVAPRVERYLFNDLSLENLEIIRFNYWPLKQHQKLVHPPGMIPQLKANPLRLFQVPSLLLCFYNACVQIIEKERIDIIHAQWVIPAGFIGSLLKKKYNIPLVITSQGAEFYLGRFHPFSWIVRETIKHSDFLLPVSNQMAERAVKFGAILSRIKVIPNSINTNIFNPRVETDFRKKYGISKNAIVVLTIRRLVPEKRVQDVILAFAKLRNFQQLYLVIGGDGPEKDELVRIVNECNIQRRVRFIGFVNNDELPPVYTGSDIYVLSSAQEGLSLSLLEALSSGCRIISTRGVGAEDLLDSKNLYTLGDTDELRNLLEHTIVNTEIERRVAFDSTWPYSVENMISKWINIYEGILKLE